MITGTYFSYYLYCHRKLWLFHNKIGMEYTSEIVSMGKEIHESSFNRRNNKFKNINIGSGVVDFIDIKNKVVYETKKSSSSIDSSIMQLKFYLYTLNDDNLTGVIEIPNERKKIKVLLNDDDKIIIENSISDINKIISGNIPKTDKSKKCNKCSYYNYCYS